MITQYIKKRLAIKERDKGCVFCKLGYETKQIYIRSRSTVNDNMNYAICEYHKKMLNENWFGRRREMKRILFKYLKEQKDESYY